MKKDNSEILSVGLVGVGWWGEGWWVGVGQYFIQFEVVYLFGGRTREL